MSEGYFCDVDFSGYGDDADPVEFYDSKMVRGRKAYACSECGEPIAVHEQHERISYRFEGKFQTDRKCAPCHEAAGEFGFAVLGGLLWEMFYEQWENGAHLQACLNRLTTAAAKEHMRRRWLKWKFRENARTTDVPAAGSQPPKGE